MKRIKFLIAVFISTFSYVLISFVAGKNGLMVYNQLLQQKKEIARQTDMIQSINNELKLEYNALSKDMDVIAAYARKLDYVSEDEKLVKINGLKPYQNTLYDYGTILRRKDCFYLSESVCKIVSLVIGGLSLLIMLLFELSRGNIKFKAAKTQIVKGIPVYEVPQV